MNEKLSPGLPVTASALTCTGGSLGFGCGGGGEAASVQAWVIVSGLIWKTITFGSGGKPSPPVAVNGEQRAFQTRPSLGPHCVRANSRNVAVTIRRASVSGSAR